MVVFDDEARTLVPLQPATAKERILREIDAITDGGSTNLTGGLEPDAIATSCLGFGADYHEDLLADLDRAVSELRDYGPGDQVGEALAALEPLRERIEDGAWDARTRRSSRYASQYLCKMSPAAHWSGQGPVPKYRRPPHPPRPPTPPIPPTSTSTPLPPRPPVAPPPSTPPSP